LNRPITSKGTETSIWASLMSDQKSPWLERIGAHHGAGKLFLLLQDFRKTLS